MIRTRFFDVIHIVRTNTSNGSPLCYRESDCWLSFSHEHGTIEVSVWALYEEQILDIRERY